jgi:hypothetical protein
MGLLLISNAIVQQQAVDIERHQAQTYCYLVKAYCEHQYGEAETKLCSWRLNQSL